MFKTLNCVKLDPSSLKRLKFVLFLNSFKIYSSGSLTAVLSSEPLFVSSEWFGCWASVASWLSWPCLNLNKHSYSGISCPTWFRSCQFFFLNPENLTFQTEMIFLLKPRAVIFQDQLTLLHISPISISRFQSLFVILMGRTTAFQCQTQTLDVYFCVCFLRVWNCSTRM